jgi:hypothetical protein
VTHGDGDMAQLLGLLMDAGVEVVEAFTPEPNTSINVRATRDLWDGKVTMWGGIAFGVLTPTHSDEEFQDYMVDLYRTIAPGDRFILGFGDNVPPEAIWHRIKWIAEFNEEYGSYPVKV